MTKSRNKKDKPGHENNIKDKLLNLLSRAKSKAYSFKEIIKKVGLKDQAVKGQFATELDNLVRSGQVARTQSGTYKINYKPDGDHIVGRVDHVNQRFAYVISEDSKEDIWVSANNLKFAFDGDIVKVLLKGKRDRGRSPEGEVVEILERKRTDFVGKIELSPRFAFVVPNSRKIFYDIFIPLDKIKDAKEGQKVVARIVEWPDKNHNPVGEVIEVLGNAGENDVEMHSIMAEYGLPWEFPETVEKDADRIPVEIPENEIKKRRDFRSITTFTIDPVDAKDFDDALSIRKLENGNWEVGVHIADVTHYVRPGTPLEKEAYKRATSVYLVDRVVPMLPEKLSNNLCSLRPHEDKLTFSAVFEMNHQGKILDEWFGKTIIHSDRRFAYEEVQEILEGKDGDFKEEIFALDELAKIMRADRFRRGAIAFETVEVKFKLDEKGKPLGVYPKVRKDAHKLIEDWMLLANRKVAEYVYFMKKGDEKNTFVYRIHDHPDPEKLNSLAIFARKFGHNLDLKDKDLSNALNKLVTDVENTPEQNVLQSLAIRSMAKAKYTTEPEKHFGLAYKHYTHFTSPIRRYPDVMVHRLLEHYLNGGKSENKTYYEDLCEHSSDMEKVAAEAERASIKYKQVEFMETMIGQEFEGIISGVVEFGMFVELVETKCEGMIRLSELEDDFYELDAENYRVIGKRNKKIFTLGDHVKVKVMNTNLEKRSIDLAFAGK